MKTNGNGHEHLTSNFSPQATATAASSVTDSMYGKTKHQPIHVYESRMNDIEHSERMKRNIGMERHGKAQVSGMTVVTFTGSSCSIAARVCFYPLTLTETSERQFEEKSWRKEHPWVPVA